MYTHTSKDNSEHINVSLVLPLHRLLFQTKLGKTDTLN